MRHSGEYSGMGGGKNIVHSSYETGTVKRARTHTHINPLLHAKQPAGCKTLSYLPQFLTSLKTCDGDGHCD